MHQVWKRSSGERGERKGRSYSIGVFENRQLGDGNALYNNESDLSGRPKGTITHRTEATVRHFHAKHRAVWEYRVYRVLMAGSLTWSLEQTYTVQKHTSMNQSITFPNSTKYRDPQMEPSSRVPAIFCVQSNPANQHSA